MPQMSYDGRFVVYHTSADTLVTDDSNGNWDVFLRDRQNDTTFRVSVSTFGGEIMMAGSYYPVISADGRYVAWYSAAGDTVDNDENSRDDVFRRGPLPLDYTD